MNCIKCGREIPEGGFFCPECAQKEAEKEIYEAPKAPHASAEKPKLSNPPAPKAEAASHAAKKSGKGFWIAIAVLSVLLILFLTLFISGRSKMNKTVAAYRIREANLALQEDELKEVQRENEDLEEKAIALQEQIDEKESLIADMKNRLHEHEVAGAQTEYDITAAQKKIEELEKSKTELQTQLTDLQKEMDDLSKAAKENEEKLEEAEENLKKAEEDRKASEEKAKFLDNYVVFVNNDGSEYYHKYDCSQFTKSNFWAYSRKLAESNGYRPCPHCCK